MRFKALILAALLAAPLPWALAQAPTNLRPIDPIVEDVDPLQRSLRKLEPGIGSPGVDSDSHIYQDNTPGGDPSKFYYIRPGVIAQYNRSDYVTVEQHKQAVTYQLVGPNTVYMLGGLSRQVAPAHDVPPSPQLVQARVAGRLEDVAPPSDEVADPGPTLEQQWQAYHRFRDSQRRVVLGALDRVATPSPVPARAPKPAPPVKP